MLEITISSIELYDEINEEFIFSKEQKLQLEHSLVSLSKWESKWKKPFFSGNKTREETLDYVKCMTINKNVDSSVYNFLSSKNIEDINSYIEDSMTATTFSKMEKHNPKSEVITSEIIYYRMIALNIPFECQKWHLNRLITLIAVCSIKNEPPKKMNKNDVLKNNKALNVSRKNAMKTRG